MIQDVEQYKNSTFCPLSILTCLVRITEKRGTISGTISNDIFCNPDEVFTAR